MLFTPSRIQIKKAAKVFAMLLSLFILSGCGFHPIYGARENSAPVAEQLNQVAIGNIPDRKGQMLRNDLIDRMWRQGRPSSPHFSLDIGLRETQEGIGLLPNATTSLTELNLYADYSFKDETGKELFQATAHAVATFHQLQAEYGTLAASETAYQRCIDEVSEQIVERLSLYFSEGTVITQPNRKNAPAPQTLKTTP